MAISYRAAHDIETLEKAVDLEILVWGIKPRDAVPCDILHALVENGGLLLVAEAQNEIVGLCLGLPARRGSDAYLWSHMTGVHPDYRGYGIGLELKRMQRDWALENGYSKICWTFDPLQRGNANFNIHLLGAAANLYHVDYYGVMTDGINNGLPSDRLEAVWHLKNARSAHDNTNAEAPKHFLTIADSRNHPQQQALPSDRRSVYIEIPSNLAQLKQQDLPLALDWRMAVRIAMQQAFAQGYTIVDFVALDDRRYVYVLTLPAPWFLYVVECQDGSLYTGITLDVKRRVKQHNSGRGAAYTASRRPVKLLATWQYRDQSHALKAEIRFKKQPRDQKLACLTEQRDFQGGVFVTLE